MSKKISLLLLGAGNMGGALLSSWLASEIVDCQTSAVIDPNPSDALLQLAEEHRFSINPVTDDHAYDVCVLAVKPQVFSDILPTLRWPQIDKTLFLSIAAGVTIQTISQLLKAQTQNAKIIRTMPNLAASVRQSMTLLCDNGVLTQGDRDLAERIFTASGHILWAKDEDQLDQLMGISGCGPAYLFLLVEAMEEVAQQQGVSKAQARLLAETTILGAAAHLHQDERP
ncbi:MAG: pyrroline-5-carboxylate reductase, partial [Pseudomonadota bacterium]